MKPIAWAAAFAKRANTRTVSGFPFQSQMAGAGFAQAGSLPAPAKPLKVQPSKTMAQPKMPNLTQGVKSAAYVFGAKLAAGPIPTVGTPPTAQLKPPAVAPGGASPPVAAKPPVAAPAAPAAAPAAAQPAALPTEWGSQFSGYDATRGMTAMMKGFDKLAPEQQKAWATDKNYGSYAKRPEAAVMNSWAGLSPEQKALAYKTWDTKPKPTATTQTPTGGQSNPNYKTLNGVRVPGQTWLPPDHAWESSVAENYWKLYHDPKTPEASRTRIAPWLRHYKVPGFEGAPALPATR